MDLLEVVIDSCELQCRYWELNSGLLVQRPMLLSTKPSLQPHKFILLVYLYICISVWDCLNVNAGACGRLRHGISLELELQMVMSQIQIL